MNPPNSGDITLGFGHDENRFWLHDLLEN